MQALLRGITDSGLQFALRAILRHWLRDYLQGDPIVIVESSLGRVKLLEVHLNCEALNALFEKKGIALRLLRCDFPEVELDLGWTTRCGVTVKIHNAVLDFATLTCPSHGLSLPMTGSDLLNAESESSSATWEATQSKGILSTLLEAIAGGGVTINADDTHITLATAPAPGPATATAFEQDTASELIAIFDRFCLRVTPAQIDNAYNLSGRAKRDAAHNLTDTLSFIFESPATAWKAVSSNTKLFVNRSESILPLLSVERININYACTFKGEFASSDSYGTLRCGSQPEVNAIFSDRITSELCVAIPTVIVLINQDDEYFRWKIVQRIIQNIMGATKSSRFRDAPEETHDYLSGSQSMSSSHEDASTSSTSGFSTSSENTSSKNDLSQSCIFHSAHSHSTPVHASEFRVAQGGALVVHVTFDCASFHWTAEPHTSLKITTDSVGLDVCFFARDLTGSSSLPELTDRTLHGGVAATLSVRGLEIRFGQTDSPIVQVNSNSAPLTLTTLCDPTGDITAGLSMASLHVRLWPALWAYVLHNLPRGNSSGKPAESGFSTRLVRLSCDALSVEMLLDNVSNSSEGKSSDMPSSWLSLSVEKVSVDRLRREICVCFESLRILSSGAPLLVMRGQPVTLGSCRALCDSLEIHVDNLLSAFLAFKSEAQIFKDMMMASQRPADAEIAAKEFDATLYCAEVSSLYHGLVLRVSEVSARVMHTGQVSPSSAVLSVNANALSLTSVSHPPQTGTMDEQKLLWPLANKEKLYFKEMSAAMQEEDFEKVLHRTTACTHNHRNFRESECEKCGESKCLSSESDVHVLVEFNMLTQELASVQATLKNTAISVQRLSEAFKSFSSTTSPKAIDGCNSGAHANVCIENVIFDVGQGLSLRAFQGTVDASTRGRISVGTAQLGHTRIFISNPACVADMVQVGFWRSAVAEFAQNHCDAAQKNCHNKPREDEEEVSISVQLEELQLSGCLDALLALESAILEAAGNGSTAKVSRSHDSNNPQRSQCIATSVAWKKQASIHTMQKPSSVMQASSLPLEARWLPLNDDNSSPDSDGIVTWSSESSNNSLRSEEGESASQNALTDCAEVRPSDFKDASLEASKIPELEKPVVPQLSVSDYLSSPSESLAFVPSASNAAEKTSSWSYRSGLVNQSHDAWALRSQMRGSSALDKVVDGRWLQPTPTIELHPCYFAAPLQLPAQSTPDTKSLPVQVKLVLTSKLQLYLKLGQQWPKLKTQRRIKQTLLRVETTISLSVCVFAPPDLAKSLQNVPGKSASKESLELKRLHSRTSVCLAGLLAVLEPAPGEGEPRRVAGAWRARTTIFERLNALRVCILSSRLPSSSALEHTADVEIQPLRLFIDGDFLTFLGELPSGCSGSKQSSARLIHVKMAALPIKVTHNVSLPSLPSLQSFEQQTLLATFLPLLRLIPLDGLSLELPCIEAGRVEILELGGGMAAAIQVLCAKWIMLIPALLTSTKASNTCAPARRSDINTQIRSVLSTARTVSGGILHVTHRMAFTAASALRVLANSTSSQGQREVDLSPNNIQPRSFSAGVSSGATFIRKQTQDEVSRLLTSSDTQRTSVRGSISGSDEVRGNNPHKNTWSTATSIATALPKLPRAVLVPAASVVHAFGVALQGMRNGMDGGERARDEEDRERLHASVYPYNTKNP